MDKSGEREREREREEEMAGKVACFQATSVTQRALSEILFRSLPLQ